MMPENLLSEWSRLLVESLADAGLHDVVISPGSRSTPLAFAFLNCPRVRCHSVIDERAAAFFALGHGKATGTPSSLVCTSGSAAANYFPAIVEASLSRTPLIVISADRPFELMDTSAPQTIDQTKMYGSYVRRFVDLGMPDGSEGALTALRRKAAQSVLDSTSPEPGPVHLNFRARKPLEPAKTESDAARQLEQLTNGILARPLTKAAPPARKPNPDLSKSAALDCGAAERGVIVCGPAHLTSGASLELVARLASLCGFPVYAEATSQLRLRGRSGIDAAFVVDALDSLLRASSFRERFAPDVVVQVGEPPVSGAWDRFVAHADTRRYVVAPHGWPDPHGTARALLVGDVDETLNALCGALEKLPRRSTAAWTAWLAEANRAAWQAVDSVLAEETAPSEGAAVRAVVDAMPIGAVLALGNSLPVRHVDAFVRAAAKDVSVVCQRGASGIDGVVSAAAGAARALGRPTVLILGDVSALHDLGGFAVAATIETPLAVVILNNDGGRIFEQLPLASSALTEGQLRFWTTPHGATFEALPGLFPVRYERPATLEALRSAVSRAAHDKGCSIVEVTVPPHGAREQYAEIARRLERVVGALPS